jgi:hypothetical protein
MSKRSAAHIIEHPTCVRDLLGHYMPHATSTHCCRNMVCSTHTKCSTQQVRLLARSVPIHLLDIFKERVCTKIKSMKYVSTTHCDMSVTLESIVPGIEILGRTELRLPHPVSMVWRLLWGGGGSFGLFLPMNHVININFAATIREDRRFKVLP